MNRHTPDKSLSTSHPLVNPAYDPSPVREIRLSQLQHNPYQPRSDDYRKDLEELIESVRQYGVLQPVLIRQIGPDQYQLIAGERRCSAAQRAGLTHVPAILVEMTDQ